MRASAYVGGALSPSPSSLQKPVDLYRGLSGHRILLLLSGLQKKSKDKGKEAVLRCFFFMPPETDARESWSVFTKRETRMHTCTCSRPHLGVYTPLCSECTPDTPSAVLKPRRGKALPRLCRGVGSSFSPSFSFPFLSSSCPFFFLFLVFLFRSNDNSATQNAQCGDGGGEGEEEDHPHVQISPLGSRDRRGGAADCPSRPCVKPPRERRR